MDFFKFKSTTVDPTNFDQGERVNNIVSSLWVERYSTPGEFSFEAKLSTGLREFLPLGTLISHADTYEMMIVENHEIVEGNEIDPTVIVTGRSFPSFLENRIVGTDLARASSTITPYSLAADFSWNQMVALINDHINATPYPDDALISVISSTPVTGTGVSVARTIEFGTVWERLSELLIIDDLGIKTIRKNTFGVGSTTNTIIQIFKGADKSSSVLFSWKAGDISSVDYLFSNKGNKNSAMVIGQYVYVIVDTGPTKYDRRMMVVDATDIDGHLGAIPTGATLTSTLAAMTTRGQQALKAQNQITISQTEIGKSSKYQYRRDYNIGDLISLDGNFGQIAVMRVVEYAEIEDENGESGHPTLALPGV